MKCADGFKFDAPIGVKFIWLLVMVVVIVSVTTVRTATPTFASGPKSERAVEPDRLRAHVETLAIKFAPRDYLSVRNLDKCAAYIGDEFRIAGGFVTQQVFEVKRKTYRNVIAEFGPDTPERIVVGAHYDSCGDTPGADDNASGVAGLIELAHLLGDTDLNRRVELVAYTLEEPPFFRTQHMGSAQHARRAANEGIDIKAMLCLEMIGYFSDVPNSQHFPSFALKALYPDTGNFLAIIGTGGDGGLTKKVKIAARGATELPVHSLSASKNYPMIDFSDHLNYWNYGFNAVMLTDTAFMRNTRYHTDDDTPDTLDYDRMADVVVGTHAAVVALANGPD